MWLQALKMLGIGAAAAAVQTVSQMLPNMLPPAIGQPLAVAIAAALAYLLPPPKK
ncbi:MAG: hypothetical protein ABSE56_02470 [Bryobacteraceae bacterium]